MPRIYINPGHCLQSNIDPGACAFGLSEAKIALEISKLVKHYLEAVGYEVMLRQSDNLYYDSDYPECDIAVVPEANNWPADLFVSIHCNAFDGVANGTETLYYPGSTNGAKLAQLIQNQIISRLKTTNRGIKERPNLVVLKRTDMPSVLVETAFIDNKKDAELLVTKQDEFARAIAVGVSDFFA